MRFAYTILYVDDVAGTLAFYETAFGLSQGMLHPSGDYGELASGATKLAFSSTRLMAEIGKTPGRPEAGRPVFEIAFTVDDVAAALSTALQAGAKLVQDVEHMPWGQTTAYVTDPNGFMVEPCTPIGDQP